MSERSTQLLIEDMQECLQKIFTYTEGLTREAFLADDLVIDAVLRNLEVIGEAASKLPDDFVDQHSSVEWHKIIGMRNRLIHAYFGVSTGIVWETIQHHLPILFDQLKALM
jgi:uncharacterized protein with HEPN domain